MVSPSSTRLLSGYNSCNSSNVSSKKRPPSSNGTGYSADREETSVFPPLVSIDLHGGRRGSSDLNGCQKRRKKNELQFAALSAKADLARAGKTYPMIDRNKEKTISTNGSIINLKGLNLIHSQEFDMPIFSSSSSANNTFVDYQMMVAACHDSYRQPSKIASSSQDSDRSSSTSWVSGTQSEAVRSNTNGSSPAFLIPPLLEDSLTSSKTDKSSPLTSTCHIISSSATAVTMSDMLQLSTKARLVANSSAPFNILHSNAAFARLTGLPSHEISGSPFSALVFEDGKGSRQASLSECLVSSSHGKNKILHLRLGASDKKSLECQIKVSPIVARKTFTREVSDVSHFAIEIMAVGSQCSSNEKSACPGEGVKNVSIEVMG